MSSWPNGTRVKSKYEAKPDPPKAGFFPAGTRVVISGLTGAVELNGKEANVVGKDNSSGRYTVEVDGIGQKNVKLENLSKVSSVKTDEKPKCAPGAVPTCCMHAIPEPSAPPLDKSACCMHSIPEPSAPPVDKLDDVEDGLRAPSAEVSAEVVEPSASQALNFGCPSEVFMDGSQLCSAPFEDLGAIVVAGPPLRPQHLFSGRKFLLVLRNPRDPTRGLVLMSSTDRDAVSQAAQGILRELTTAGPELVTALEDYAVYDALSSDPHLLAVVASSCQAGEHALSQLLSHAPQDAPLANGNATHSISQEAESPARIEDESCHCPICFESIDEGDAAMRCAGNGGVHHYFHSSCLQQWVRSCRHQEATCPMCRGSLQFNAQRLNDYLQNDSQDLTEEERSVLQRIADGLKGRNGWSGMDRIEKAAHVGGIVAAGGFGFMLGYSGSHEMERATMEVLNVVDAPRNHQIAQGVGWAIGVLVRVIREALKDRERDEDRR